MNKEITLTELAFEMVVIGVRSGVGAGFMASLFDEIGKAFGEDGYAIRQSLADREDEFVSRLKAK